MVWTNKIWSWLSILIVTGGGISCGQDSQKNLNRSVKEMRTCADGQVFSSNEEITIRQQINADKKAQQIEEIFQQKVRGGLNGNVLVAQKRHRSV